MSDTHGHIASDPTALPPGTEMVGGKLYLPDAKGNLVPLDLVKPADRLEDEMVRKVMAYAEELNRQIARFLGHTMEDIGSFVALLEQEYGARRGGPKGNASFTSFDGLMQIRVQRADLVELGPQLQTAKKLIDEYLNELTSDARPEIQAIITRAFDTDKEGSRALPAAPPRHRGRALGPGDAGDHRRRPRDRLEGVRPLLPPRPPAGALAGGHDRPRERLRGHGTRWPTA